MVNDADAASDRKSTILTAFKFVMACCKVKPVSGMAALFTVSPFLYPSEHQDLTTRLVECISGCGLNLILFLKPKTIDFACMTAWHASLQMKHIHNDNDTIDHSTYAKTSIRLMAITKQLTHYPLMQLRNLPLPPYSPYPAFFLFSYSQRQEKQMQLNTCSCR